MTDPRKDDKNLEQTSAVFDGEELSSLDLNGDLAGKNQDHMQNWAIIGSAMRNELPKTIDLSFAARVRARISTIVPLPANDGRGFSWKAAAKYLSQGVVAAAVASVTVIGYQTYNASDISSMSVESSAVHQLPEGMSVNLASYQNGGQGFQFNSTGTNGTLSFEDRQLLKEKQEAEIKRVKSYLRNYVVETASK